MLYQWQLDKWIDENGPWAYHFTRSVDTQQRILSEGVKPYALDVNSSYWCAELTPRPGHSYFCCGVGVGLIADQSFGGLDEYRVSFNTARAVAIDLRALNPALVVPDEDCCFESNLTLALDRPYLISPGACDPSLTVADVSLIYETDGPPLSERSYASYGEWADKNSVGSHPRHRYACLRTFGSMAYGGTIPAAALRPAETQELTELQRLYKAHTAAVGVVL